MGSDEYEALSAVRDGTESESVEQQAPADLGMPDPRYVETWRRKRTWTILGLSGLAAFLCAGPAFMYLRLFAPWAQALGDVPLFACALPGALIYLVAAFQFAKCVCPRCRRPFVGGILYEGLLTYVLPPRTCHRCGLPLGAPHDPDAGQ